MCGLRKALAKLFKIYFSVLGALKIWNTSSSRCVYTQQFEGVKQDDSTEKHDTEPHQSFVAASYNQTLDSINVVTFDHNILLCNSDDLHVRKQVNKFDVYAILVHRLLEV